MPTQISICRACQAPIFVEDEVPGSCVCQEGIWHTLLARQQHENRQGRTRTASQAPTGHSPEPFMFLSREARSELEGALSQTNPKPRTRPTREQNPRPDRSFGADDLGDRLDFEMLARDEAPTDDGFQVEFDSGDLDVEDDRPTQRAQNPNRFRVDRPPQHRPFVAQIEPGPQGGPMEEIGQVGRFRLLREAQPRQLSREEAVRLERPEPPPNRNRPTASLLNAQQQARSAVEHEKLPTAFERLAQGDFLSGDDDWD